MGDPGDFGEIGTSDIESDGGRWEDTLRAMEQCDTGTMTHSIPKEVSYIPRFFIIKSLNYHNLEKSVEKGIWATQAMNERILNEAFETAKKVLLIFSVNMSGHFQGYAQMTSPIGRRKVNVWSEANWGGTFTVEWIRLYDLPFQKTLHLKNLLNSFKPVKISRDCQELTTEIGEDLCALIDGGADSEFSKRRIHVRTDYFMKKPLKMVVAEDWPTPKSAIRRLSHTHSTVAVKVALYSASQLEVATVGCFLLNQDIHELPSMKQKPLVDTRVS
ncbi:hypothetical protein KP509_02G075600 [Ceratopteris richardii]|uniref:YTH domain-containing protein n=1 Tax=Ceratopteris richardii TaxID=49495 RepID=A0A8T2VEG2_CERRI|nr:hypothetical protein KP509_02G075600 [Ceratopteris richardii]